jgi:hypothetical protein
MYIIFVFDLMIHLYWGVCLRMYAFDLFLRRVCIVLRCVLCQCGNIYTYRLHMFGKCIMGYEYLIYSIDTCLDVSICSVCQQYFKCIFLACAYL